MRGVLALLAVAGCAQGIDHADPTAVLSMPGGTFMMGTPVACDDSPCTGDRLQHPVTVSAFAIEANEVTVLQYEVCVGQHQCDPADTWDYDRRQRPVEVPSVLHARQYCKAIGRRLATEAEWEFAARFQGNGVFTTYPWGDSDKHDCSIAVADCHGGLADVATVAGDVTAAGVHDMGGNVTEWVDDDYVPAIGCADSTPAEVIGCGGTSHCASDGCRASIGTCQAACAAGLTDTSHYCPSAMAVPKDPLRRTTRAAPMIKGSGVGLRACMEAAGMRVPFAAIPKLGVAGFRCVAGNAPAPTVTARFALPVPDGIRCESLVVTPVTPPGSAAAWQSAQVTLALADVSLAIPDERVAGTRGDSGSFTFGPCTAMMNATVIVDAAPLVMLDFQVQYKDATGMNGSCHQYEMTMDLTKGEAPGAEVSTSAMQQMCP